MRKARESQQTEGNEGNCNNFTLFSTRYSLTLPIPPFSLPSTSLRPVLVPK